MLMHIFLGHLNSMHSLSHLKLTFPNSSTHHNNTETNTVEAHTHIPSEQDFCTGFR